MSWPQWIITIASFAALIALLLGGGRLDRWAALALLTTQISAPLLAPIEVAGIRVGVAATSFLLGTALICLALAGRRWWLLAAAGVQVVAVASWVYQILDPGAQVWAAVTFRIIVWMELMALAAFGVLEARNAPYAVERP